MTTNTDAVPSTPAAQWRVDGEKDPHAGHYDGERAALTLGKLTDDELANGVFMNADQPMDIARMLARDPDYHPPIVWLTAAKERIRWLSRALERAIAPTPAVQAEAGRVPTDDFNGSTDGLIRSIMALLDLDAAGVLKPHGVGGHARKLLSAAAARLLELPKHEPGPTQPRGLVAQSAATLPQPTRYFVYDHEGGYNEFKTDAERKQGHQAAIDAYLDTGCDGWSEEVTNVVSGTVTHRTVKTHEEYKPDPCAVHLEHDDESCDDCAAWTEWPNHDFDTVCRYEPKPIAAHASSAGDQA
jgi:hypothetical protein